MLPTNGGKAIRLRRLGLARSAETKKKTAKLRVSGSLKKVSIKDKRRDEITDADKRACGRSAELIVQLVASKTITRFNVNGDPPPPRGAPGWIISHQYTVRQAA